MNALNGLDKNLHTYVNIKLDTTMDIKQLGTAGQAAVDNRRADRIEPGPTSAKADAPAATRQPPEVEVSAEAKAVASALASVSTKPAFDDAKVARIKTAIDEGRYSVSAERLASKLVRFEESFKERP